MSTEIKISPAFDPFLAHSGPHDKHDAIVIYRAPEGEGSPVRGRIRALRQRLQHVKDMAAAQRPVEAKLFESYQRVGNKTLPNKTETQFETSSIGSSALPVASVEVTPRSLPVLAEQEEVVAILPNQSIHLILPKQVDYQDLGKQEEKDGLTWGLKRLRVPEIWNQWTRGKGISVAVLDTGVYSDHPTLAGRVKDFVVIDPLGRRIETKGHFDCGTHGTHVCGTVAGGKADSKVAIGMAPEASLLVAGVLVGDSTLKTLIEGISWAVEKGADVINMSLGFTYYEPLFSKVFTLLVDEYGVLPVVAIGNENHGNCSSPGNAHSALSVGATEKVKGGKLEVSFFSSGASLVFPGEEPAALVTKPDVVAPGAQVFSCIPPHKKPHGSFDYSYMDGTSMATPHVAGAAALLMAAHPTAPVSQIIGALRETAEHPKGSDRRPDNRWGYGMIRPLEALQALA